MNNDVDTPQKETTRSVVGRIAHAMTSGELSNGDLAELRRIAPAQPYTPALWKILVSFVPDAWTMGDEREVREDRWAALLMAMAMTAGLHDPSVRFGSALAHAGYSELRFVRLLRASESQLFEAVRRLAQYLSSKGQPADWTDCAHLILDQRGDWAEKHRRRVARDYYRTLYQIESQNQ